MGRERVAAHSGLRLEAVAFHDLGDEAKAGPAGVGLDVGLELGDLLFELLDAVGGRDPGTTSFEVAFQPGLAVAGDGDATVGEAVGELLVDDDGVG